MYTQAVEALEAQYVGDLERAMAVALDPRKLTPASSGAAGLGPGGARSAGSPAPGSTAKWQAWALSCHQQMLAPFCNVARHLPSSAWLAGLAKLHASDAVLQVSVWLPPATCVTCELRESPMQGMTNARIVLTTRNMFFIGAQEALWSKLGAVLEQLHAAAVAVWHVQRVLAKKRDPLTHTLFLDVIMADDPDGPLPCERVW